MPSTASLIDNLAKDLPDISFKASDSFYWSPEEKTVYYIELPSGKNDSLLLFHELGHALLGHQGYSRDVELLRMENDAWEKGLALAKEYPSQFKLNEPKEAEMVDNFVQSNLDTYRDWMHARSTCPACTATGFQVGPKEYSCPACSQKWSVNEAKICGLKRYKIK